jgi:electron transfer flavoprotein alpha subunit
MADDILVVAEHKNGELDNVTFQLMGKGRELADKSKGRLSLLILGAGIEFLAGELASKGADIVLVAEDSRLEPYTPEGHSKVVCDVIREFQPAILLFGHTYRGIEMAPAVAARLGVALASNCLDLELQDDALFAIRPVFESTMHVRAEFYGPRPWIASIQKGVLSMETSSEKKAEVMPVRIEIADEDIRTRVVGLIRPPKSDIDITKADIIVAVGRGIKSMDGLPLVEELGDALGGVVACSRPIADMGWLPSDRHVGMSGKTVSPRVYIACGISGANQHVLGMRDSQLIIAVNTDVNAPIFQVAHYGVVGDLSEILPALTEETRSRT